jgi:hypothetical protein
MQIQQENEKKMWSNTTSNMCIVISLDANDLKVNAKGKHAKVKEHT